MKRTWKLTVALAVALSMVLLSGERSFAQPAREEKIRTVVYLIKASNDLPGVDPEIRHIVKQFQGAFRYSTYRLVSKIPATIPLGGEEKIALPGLREMEIRCRGYEGNRIKLQVKIKQKRGRDPSREVLDTEFRIVDGGTIIIGGYDYRGDKLIMAISADMRR